MLAGQGCKKLMLIPHAMLAPNRYLQALENPVYARSGEMAGEAVRRVRKQLQMTLS